MLTRNVDPILSMINFIFHFICIVPFDKGNGRMVRLLFSLLLIKEEHAVVKYISLDAIIKQWENTYYEALYKSAANWFSEEHNLVFMTDCFLHILHAAYEELQATLLPYQIKGQRSLQLRDYIVKQRAFFQKKTFEKDFLRFQKVHSKEHFSVYKNNIK